MSRFAVSGNTACACSSTQCKNEKDCCVVTLHIPVGVLADVTQTRDRLVEEANSAYFSMILQQLRQCNAEQFNTVTEAGVDAIGVKLPNFSGI